MPDKIDFRTNNYHPIVDALLFVTTCMQWLKMFFLRKKKLWVVENKTQTKKGDPGENDKMSFS